MADLKFGHYTNRIHWRWLQDLRIQAEACATGVTQGSILQTWPAARVLRPYENWTR